MPLKIIAGKFRGRGIESLPGYKTRPLLSRAKKSLFDILNPVMAGSVFLDLFSGFGTVGIEALSRGAKRAVFVESDGDCVKTIEKNLARFGLSGSAEVIRRDASRPDLLTGRFDIIFIGPPYGMKMLSDIILKSEKLLSESGLIVGQHHKKEILKETLGGLSLYRWEKYGDMRLSFYKKT